MSRFTSGHLVLASVALIVGVGLGRFGLQGELREARSELARAEARPCDDRGGVGRQIAEALGGRGVVDLPERPPNDAPEPARSSDPPPIDDPNDSDDSNDADEGSFDRRPAPGDPDSEDPDPEDPDPEDPDPRDAIADAVALRLAQSRRALLEQARPTDEQLARIDEAMAVMNDVLIEEAEILLATGEEPTRRDGLEFARNSIDALLAAEDDLLDSLTDEQLARVDPQVLDPLGFIEPAVVETLVELER